MTRSSTPPPPTKTPQRRTRRTTRGFRRSSRTACSWSRASRCTWPRSTGSDATSCRSPASPTVSTRSLSSRAREDADEVNRMTIDTADRAREKGIALVYVGVFLVPLLICTGLAVDLGRGYLVRATLAKAVDAAALAAARNITAAEWQPVATRIFDVNFPPG